MHKFERVYMRILRQIYDTERQLLASAQSLTASNSDDRLLRAVREIEKQSREQIARIERLFALLYLDARPEASWVATALLREAWDTSNGAHDGGVYGCAAALLALKRYEITLYEALLRWSEQIELDEAVADIRRSIAEELVQASVLSELAFSDDTAASLRAFERPALH